MVSVGHVELQGGFPELADANRAFASALEGRRVSLAEIHRAADGLAGAYAAAGYVLVRVVLPPQSLVDGGPVRVVVVDGFIEAVDANGVAPRARRGVEARLRSLIGRRHVTIARIERAVLIAGDTPGLRLRSTLARGERQGGARLIVDGPQNLVSASVSVDNRLGASLGTWSFTTTLALNDALGLGEQVYGSFTGGADLSRLGAGRSPIEVWGVGAVIPLGDDGWTINPEAIVSDTRPAPIVGAPDTRGHFERLALHLSYPLIRSRAQSLNLTGSVEHIEERIAATRFATDLSLDRFNVVRLRFDAQSRTATGGVWALGGQLSQGVEGLGSRSQADAAASGVPLSRQGAGPGFTKLDVQGSWLQPLPMGLQATLSARAQTGFGRPLLRSEQVSMDGADALSGFDSGELSVDQAVLARGELARPIALSSARGSITLAPYAFAAGGAGRIERPTAVEKANVDAGSVGLGLRGTLRGAGRPGQAVVGVEAARRFSNVPALSDGYRVNVFAALRF
jgi:hemolysin activation/secretion protein